MGVPIEAIKRVIDVLDTRRDEYKKEAEEGGYYLGIVVAYGIAIDELRKVVADYGSGKS